MRYFCITCLVSLLVGLIGCTPVEPKDHLPQFHARKPASILVIPAVNRTVDVEAPMSVLSTLPKLLAEKGYYVFPVNTVKTLLEFEGLYEADEVHSMPAPELADLFGADSILYITVHEWTTQYLFVQARTIVDLEYSIVAKDGTRLWATRKRMTHEPQSSVSTGSATANLLAAAIDATLERLSPDFMPLARKANDEAFLQGIAPLPPGPYSPEFDDYYLALYPEPDEP